MKRIWINYNLWEDHKNGLYSKNKQEEAVIELVFNMFKNGKFYGYAKQCLYEWPNSMNHNLSFDRSNRRSYIGQATACYKFGANVMTTCKAWERLTKEDQDDANYHADAIISIYENKIYKEPKQEESNEELS